MEIQLVSERVMQWFNWRHLRISQAMEELKGGPITVTSDGDPAYVVLSLEDYRFLTKGFNPNKQRVRIKGVLFQEI